MEGRRTGGTDRRRKEASIRTTPVRSLLATAVYSLVIAMIPGAGLAVAETDSLSAREGHAHARLFVAQAWPLPAGGGFVGVQQLFMPVAGYGFADRVSISGGITLLPGADRQYIALSPAVTLHSSESMAASCGAAYIGEIGGDGAGVAYGAVSLGAPGGSGTIGLGWGFRGEGLADRPSALAGFQLPLGRGTTLVSENWIPLDLDPAILSAGLRFTSGRTAVDLAVWLPAWRWGGAGLPVVPWVSLAWGF